MEYLNVDKMAEMNMNNDDIGDFKIIEKEGQNNENILKSKESYKDLSHNGLLNAAEKSEKNVNDHLNTFPINSLDSLGKNEMDLIKYNSGDNNLGKTLKYNTNNVRNLNIIK